jgi:ankyrin repeat protein
VDVNLHDEDGCTALCWAIQNGHNDIIVELMKHNNMDVNHQDNGGGTALMLASREGKTETVVKMLRHDKVDRESS